MAINLEKGGRINLSKDLSIHNPRVGLVWSANSFEGEDFDPDSSAFVLDKNGKALSDLHFVFYNNQTSPEGAVIHSGDDRVGGDGNNDNETIRVDLTKMPAAANSITFVVTIHKAEERKQNFGQIKGCAIHIYDGESSKPAVEYRLEDEFSTQTAVLFGSIERRGNDWIFIAEGQGYKRGLAEFVRAYGLSA